MLQDIVLPPPTDLDAERHWLESALLDWLHAEFFPEPNHPEVARRTAQIYTRQRLEGEDLVMAIHIALLAELRHFDFGPTAMSEFVIANAVADLLLVHFARVE